MKLILPSWMICGLLCSLVVAEDVPTPADIPMWEDAEIEDTDSSVVAVGVKDDAGSTGSGVVVSVEEDKPHATMPYRYGRIVTAKHVVQKCNYGQCRVGTRIKVSFVGGKQSMAKVVRVSKEWDAAMLIAWVPNTVQPTPIATRPAPIGARCRFVGLGSLSDRPPEVATMRRFWGRVARVSDSRELFSGDALLLSGDSGGPVFYKNEVVAVISGGWRWFNLDANTAPVTWPARSISLEGINQATGKHQMPDIPTGG